MTDEQIAELKALEEQAFNTYRRINILREQMRPAPDMVSPLDYVVSDTFRAYKTIQETFFHYM